MFNTALKHNLDVSYHWIEGHQDDNIFINKLPIMAQLNIEEDQLVGKY